eukprot:scaffold87520_cov52-Attheya_sp.AAC.1
MLQMPRKSQTTYGWRIGRWDVSKVEDFSCLFRSKNWFSEDIGSWDVSNAIYMTRMFANTKTFNQDISSWNTANVKHMNAMFQYASEFNRDIMVMWKLLDSGSSSMSQPTNVEVHSPKCKHIKICIKVRPDTPQGATTYANINRSDVRRQGVSTVSNR